MTSAKCANTCASKALVLARWPTALAKSWTGRGLTTPWAARQPKWTRPDAHRPPWLPRRPVAAVVGRGSASAGRGRCSPARCSPFPSQPPPAPASAPPHAAWPYSHQSPQTAHRGQVAARGNWGLHVRFLSAILSGPCPALVRCVHRRPSLVDPSAALWELFGFSRQSTGSAARRPRLHGGLSDLRGERSIGRRSTCYEALGNTLRRSRYNGRDKSRPLLAG